MCILSVSTNIVRKWACSKPICLLEALVVYLTTWLQSLCDTVLFLSCKNLNYFKSGQSHPVHGLCGSGAVAPAVSLPWGGVDSPSAPTAFSHEAFRADTCREGRSHRAVLLASASSIGPEMSLGMWVSEVPWNS